MPVLQDISLTMKEGEILALVGLNGAGKTSLLSSILDLLKIDSGQITLFGITHTNARSRCDLCFLPEQLNPPPLLQGHEYIAHRLSAYGLKPERVATENRAEELGLAPEALRQPIRTYSKGMRQKLGMIATLLSDRPLLILDEPMSGLDPLARMQLRDTLMQYSAQGRSILFTSHLLSDVEILSNRIALLHQGKLGFVGTPNALMAAQPAHSGVQTLEDAFLHAIDVKEMKEHSAAIG